MADVILGEQVFNGVLTVKLNTTDGGTVEFHEANVDSYVATVSGATVFDPEAGLAMVNATDMETAEQGPSNLAELCVMPHFMVVNGVVYKPADIAGYIPIPDSSFGYVCLGNGSLVNDLMGTNFPDNGLDFCILTLEFALGFSNIITKVAKDVTVQFIYNAKWEEKTFYEKTYTPTIENGSGVYVFDDFPLGLDKCDEVIVEFDYGAYHGSSNRFYCKVTHGSPNDYFGDDACRIGEGAGTYISTWEKRTYTPFYVYVSYENMERQVIKSATIYTAESNVREHKLKLTTRKWTPIAYDFSVPDFPVVDGLPYGLVLDSDGTFTLVLSDVPLVNYDGHVSAPDTGVVCNIYAAPYGFWVINTEGYSIPGGEMIAPVPAVVKANYELVSA